MSEIHLFSLLWAELRSASSRSRGGRRRNRSSGYSTGRSTSRSASSLNGRAVKDVTASSGNGNLLSTKSKTKLVEAVLYLEHVLGFVQIDGDKQIDFLVQ